MKRNLFALVVVFSLLAPTVTHGGPVLIGGSLGGTIYDVDPLTGIASNPRDTGLDRLYGLAFSPDGVLFGLGRASAGSRRSLITIDPDNGTTALVGEVSLGFRILDFDLDATTGDLYGESAPGGGGSSSLYTIVNGTSDVTVVGPRNSDPASVAINRFGQLYAPDYASQSLVELDKTNGDVLSTIPLGNRALFFSGSAFAPDGSLFLLDGGFASDSSLYVFDIPTATLTTIGPTGVEFGLTSLAHIPEPGTLLLFVTCGWVILTHYRRPTL